MLIAILVVTSGFVAGTTASFTASTRNGGNTFTVGAIFSPTAPAGTFSNATASFSWTNVDSVTYPVNSGVGYRVLRGSSALGPTDTAGSAPNCTSASFSTLTYASSSPVTDSAFTANAGQYVCYAAEGVYPCCPTTGKIPVITSLQGRIYSAIQTGYVAKSWSFNSGNNNNQVDSGEKLILSFNQDVSVSTSITASENLCIDPFNKRILFGVSTTTGDSCQFEVQKVVLSGTPTTGTIKFTYGSGGSNTTAAVNCISSAANATTIQSAMQGLTGINGSNVFVTEPVNGQYWFFFGGTMSGNLSTVVGTTSNGCKAGSTALTATASTVFNGATETMSLGYLSNSGTYSGSVTGGFCATTCTIPARYDISAVAWSNCTVANVSCKTATITLGSNLGSNVPTLPTGTWTFVPSPASGKSTSATGTLTLCTTNPSGSPSNGLCQPTASAGW